MNNEYCEKVRMSAMAISDVEQTQLSEKEISEHISACDDCRLMIKQLQISVKLLDGRQRKSYDVNVLNEVESALSQAETSPKNSKYSAYFIVLGFALFILKIINLSPVETIGIFIRFLTIVVIFVFFVSIKQNPFTIKDNL